MKVQTYVETCQPAESPRLGGAEAPPFDKGGFGQAADTGRVREATIRRKLSCALSAATRRRYRALEGQ